MAKIKARYRQCFVLWRRIPPSGNTGAHTVANKQTIKGFLYLVFRFIVNKILNSTIVLSPYENIVFTHFIRKNIKSQKYLICPLKIFYRFNCLNKHFVEFQTFWKKREINKILKLGQPFIYINQCIKEAAKISFFLVVRPLKK